MTNATWRDFWLNEGFTVYIERRIVEDIYGEERARSKRCSATRNSRRSRPALARDQILHIDLDGRDPDEGMTQVPYERGPLPDRAGTGLRPRPDSTPSSSVTSIATPSRASPRPISSTTQGESLSARPPAAAGSTSTPGSRLRASRRRCRADSARLDAVDKLASEWTAGKVTARDLPGKDWSTQEWLRFLRALPEDSVATAGGTGHRVWPHGSRKRRDRAQWLLIAIRNGYRAGGRPSRSLLDVDRPAQIPDAALSELAKTPKGREGQSHLARARPYYHPTWVGVS